MTGKFNNYESGLYTTMVVCHSHQAKLLHKSKLFEIPGTNTIYVSPGSTLAGYRVDKIIVVDRQTQYKQWYDEVLSLCIWPDMHCPEILYVWV